MGNEQSSAAEQNDWGYHVLRVLANSPAASAGLEPWFDYICGVNSTKIDHTNANLLTETVHSAAQQGLPLTFTVFSAKGQTIRGINPSLNRLSGDVYLDPTGGTEVGLSLRWCPLSSASNVFHVLDVYPSSPAEIAGFIPFSDYIIGSPEGAIRDEPALGELVEAFLRRPLRFWVYNSTHDIVRVVTIVPDRSWGGDGAMGFNIGYGYLHRIPAPLSSAVVFDSEAAPMQTAFELAQQQQQPQAGDARPSTERKSSDLSRPPLPTHARRRPSHSGKRRLDIDAILREGQDKSEKEDIIQAAKGADGALPPPPPKRHVL